MILFPHLDSQVQQLRNYGKTTEPWITLTLESFTFNVEDTVNLLLQGMVDVAALNRPGQRSHSSLLSASWLFQRLSLLSGFQNFRLQLAEPFQETFQFFSLSVGELLTWFVYEFPVSQRSWHKLQPDPIPHGNGSDHPFSDYVMLQFRASLTQPHVLPILFRAQVRAARSNMNLVHPLLATRIFLSFLSGPM